MFKSVVKGALLAGVIVFVWNFLSWMVLPWHKDTFKKFTNEQNVSAAIKANAPTPGIYCITGEPAKTPHPREGSVRGPFVFAAVNPAGVDMACPRFLVIGLLTQIVAGGVLGAILHLSCCQNFWKKVNIVLLLCVFTGLVAYVPNWNWLQFPADYMFQVWIDLVVGWFLAALALARFIKPCKGTC